ncbi:MAG TPA: hypothetical protein VIJ33_02940 [Solirubrobacteraceae bacterium]
MARRPDRRDHERDRVFGYVQEECCRCGVEQLCVVDPDHYLSARRLLAEHVDEDLDEAGLVLEAHPGWDELAEGRQRDA